MQRMSEIDVHLRFESEHDRETVLAWLRRELPAGELIEPEGGDPRIRRLEWVDENIAQMRVQNLVHGACQGTDVDPGRVRILVGGWNPAD